MVSTSKAAAILAIGAWLSAGCGDDGTTADGGSTGGTDTSTTAMDSSGGSPTSSAIDSTGSDSGGVDSTGDPSTTSTSSTATDPTGDSSTGPTNLPPEPVDDLYFVREDLGPLLVDAATGVLVNDVEPDGEGLSVDSSDALSDANGIVVMGADGSFQYTPPPDFIGEDTFDYVVADDSGATTEATVTVSVGAADIDVGELNPGPRGFFIDGAVAGEAAGFAARGGGDVDGDGLDDLVVSSESAASGAGRVWVVFGKADGATVDLASVAMGVGGFVIEPVAPGDNVGHAVDIVDDVDGDGLDDILIGAPGAGSGGVAYLVHGKAGTGAVLLAQIAAGVGGFAITAEGASEDLGTSVAGAGDVDGDGRGDLLVGAPFAGPIPGGGRSYVVFGKSDTNAVAGADLYAGTGGFVVRGVGFDDNLGNAVAGLGDVNGDGLDDLGVGARLANAGGLGNSGRCYVVFGKTNTTLVDVGTLGAGGFFISGAETSDEACASLAGPGDIDGDGLADILVGVPGSDGPLTFQGRVLAVFGKNNTTAVALGDIVAGTGGFVVEGENLGDFLGIRPIGGGDVTGDGFADLVLGSPAVDLPGSSAGRGYVVFAKDDGTAVPLSDLTTRLGGYRIVADATQGQLGWAVDHAGDVDGDGFGDMILSAYEYNGPAGADAGRIFVVFGGNDRGAVTHLGTAGDDTLDGSAGSDVLVAGAGADVVHGGGGSDVIYAGAGDDTIGISGGSFFRIDGGTGVDTLAFEDGGVNLSLALVPDLALRGVEIVDLTGTGDNGFSIARRDLRKIVGASKSLRIEGDAGDTFDADLTGGTFVDQGVSAGVHTWSDGVITLEVVDPVVANVQL